MFVYDGDNLIEETNASGTAVACYEQTQNIDEPLAMLRSSTTSFYQADGLGSVTSLSNTSGALASSYAYDSFGKLTASTGSLVNPFRYTARESDTETGLYYYRARYYDSTGGRFLNSDPIDFDGGLNFYSYVANNSVNFLDPWGLKLCKVNLPGIGKTYLDDAFYPRVKQWIDANGAAGVRVDFTQAFRSTEQQEALANDPNAITPAKPGTSLHEAGFAVDVAWSRIPREFRPIVIANARAAGLVWGGNFKHPKPDPVHFQRDPGSRKGRIQQAQADYKGGVTCDCI